MILGALWGHAGVILGILGWLSVTFGLVFDHFGHMMCTCAGLVGPKSENVEKVYVFEAFLKGARER